MYRHVTQPTHLLRFSLYVGIARRYWAVLGVFGTFGYRSLPRPVSAWDTRDLEGTQATKYLSWPDSPID